MKTLIPTIGMEVHVELKTVSKMFCGCSAHHFQIKPNTHTCPVCLGLPGALPVPNLKAVEWTILIGLALNCKINLVSKFDRKHYFYPDLSKGYQISQYDEPLCVNGYLNLSDGSKIGIRRVHLEEDTGKLVHKTIDGKKVSLVDFNRSGVPLVEIVTEADLTSGAQAKEYLKTLSDLLKTLKVSDCSMETGSMRLEANISLTADKNKLANYKVEVKNLNSFRYVENSINYELKRQAKILAEGKTPKQETRGYNQAQKITFSQRSKEEAEDYRYFPEPDIPPMEFSQAQIDSIGKLLPKLPQQLSADLITKHHLSQSTAKQLVKNETHLAYFYQHLNDQIKPVDLANLIINKKINLAKPLSSQLTKTSQEVDTKLIDKIIADNQDAVAKYLSGKTSVIGFLVGQVMKATAGKVDPNTARKLLLAKLN